MRPSNQLLAESISLNVITLETPISELIILPTTVIVLCPYDDYCKQVEHTKDKCYKLHGYPQSFAQN